MENQTAEQKPYKEWAKEEVERRRRREYSDCHSGSDRFFSEAIRLRAEGKESEAAEAEQLGITRYEEIKVSNPYPSDTQ